MKNYSKYFFLLFEIKQKEKKTENKIEICMKKVSPFVSKTLSKITTIIYISTKIFWILKNICNDKRGFLFLTVKNDTVDKICKRCNEKNKICI